MTDQIELTVTGAVKVLEGSKGGSAKTHTPVEQNDSLRSIAKVRMLLALGEGEFGMELDDTKIFFDNTPLGNADGSRNFDKVRWETRPGVQTQTPIAGFPAVENETSLGIALKKDTPWTRAISNTELDAVVLRIGIPTLVLQEEDGDRVGTSVSFHIDLNTGGAGYQTVGTFTITGKTTTLYERSIRVDLPPSSSGWQVRVVRDTADSTSTSLVNTTQIQAITEVIDGRFRYPHTALLFVEFDAQAFQDIPKVSCRAKGRIIQVPVNYDPVGRTYTGIWDGTFKWAWSNNPAWVWYDILTAKRFGLGQRVTGNMLDKWELYVIAQRCDQLIDNGQGGVEPRYLLDMYIQSQEEAWTVIKDIAAVFNGMTFWGNNMFNIVSDMPVRDEDIDLTVTRANMIGKPAYTSGSRKNRYSSAVINYSDAGNHYADATTAKLFPELARQFGFNQATLTAIACTRETEAQRRGAYYVLTNYVDRMITFRLGMEGISFTPGQVFALADERVAGKTMGGRVVSYAGRVITLDRAVNAAAGDFFMVRLVSGDMARVAISSVSGSSVTLSSALAASPLDNAVFVIDSGQLALQKFRVTSLTFDPDKNEFEIAAGQYNASKYDAVDLGARLDEAPISLLPTGIVNQPTNIAVTSYDRVVQGARVSTLRATWTAPVGADGRPQPDVIKYDIQFKRGSNDWINIPSTGQTAVEIDGIYEGDYLVRVRAINSGGASSLWASSVLTHLSGRAGEVPVPLGFSATTDQVFAIQLSWAFGQDTGDTSYTEIQYASINSVEAMQALTLVPYPQRTFIQSGIKAGVTFYYRARLVDRLGNKSAWTTIVTGQSSFDANAIIDVIDEAIRNSDAFAALKDPIDTNIEGMLQNALNENATVSYQFKQYGENKAEIATISKTTADQLGAFATTVNQVQASVADNTAAVQQVSTAVANVDGKLSAGYGVKVQLNAAGQPYIAGMQIGIQSDGQTVQSYALFNADTFAVYNGTGSSAALPFVIQGGQVFIRDAFIADGAITNAKIGAFIQSTNYSAGSVGWRLDKSGTFENNGSDGAGRMVQNNTAINVYDANGVRRVAMGKIS